MPNRRLQKSSHLNAVMWERLNKSKNGTNNANLKFAPVLLWITKAEFKEVRQALGTLPDRLSASSKGVEEKDEEIAKDKARDFRPTWLSKDEATALVAHLTEDGASKNMKRIDNAEAEMKKRMPKEKKTTPAEITAAGNRKSSVEKHRKAGG